jgi:hypothetical protein
MIKTMVQTRRRRAVRTIGITDRSPPLLNLQITAKRSSLSTSSSFASASLGKSAQWDHAALSRSSIDSDPVNCAVS